MKRFVRMGSLLTAALMLLSMLACVPETLPAETQTQQTTAEQTETVPETELGTEQAAKDPAQQNKLLISEQDFDVPALTYRALKIEHNFNSLPGATYAEKAASLVEYGFGGAACNMVWDQNYLQQGQTLEEFVAFVKAANEQGVPQAQTGAQFIVHDSKP